MTIQFQFSLALLSLDSCYIKQQTPASGSTLLLPGLAGSTEIPRGFHCLAFLWHFYSSSAEYLRWYQTEIWLRKKNHAKSMPCTLDRLATGRFEMQLQVGNYHPVSEPLVRLILGIVIWSCTYKWQGEQWGAVHILCSAGQTSCRSVWAHGQSNAGVYRQIKCNSLKPAVGCVVLKGTSELRCALQCRDFGEIHLTQSMLLLLCLFFFSSQAGFMTTSSVWKLKLDKLRLQNEAQHFKCKVH